MNSLFAAVLMIASGILQGSHSRCSGGCESCIGLNQVGFYPASEKIAVYRSGNPDITGSFSIVSVPDGNVVYEAEMSDARRSPFSETYTYILDFTGLSRSGTYRILAPGTDCSPVFEVREDIFCGIATDAMKAFYYQRASCEIEERYAGIWSRRSAHPDTSVSVHPSAAGPGRPAGSVISSPGGWYDAGDYNKYIVNSGYTVALLMSLYEDYTEFSENVDLNIPESCDDVPDILNEVYWNLSWMLTMQDPYDGGVYHKLTTDSFEDFISPDECRKRRYVVQKSLQASLQFSASMAQASRLFSSFGRSYPGFSEKCKEAAVRAFAWSLGHSDAFYSQQEINREFKPEIYTGEYGDRNASDEFFWAAAELYLLTGEDMYISSLKKHLPEKFLLPTWQNVTGLGYMTCLRHRDRFSGILDIDAMAGKLDSFLVRKVRGTEKSYYMVPAGRTADDYSWGSNSESFAVLGAVMMFRYARTGDRKLLANAVRTADYLLGRNPSGYCFVTGSGHKSPLHIHHRISAADGIDAPVPGLLVGGPNTGRQDKCVYPFPEPDRSYADVTESYASNEIAINWQATLVYLLWSICSSMK